MSKLAPICRCMEVGSIQYSENRFPVVHPLCSPDRRDLSFTIQFTQMFLSA